MLAVCATIYKQSLKPITTQPKRWAHYRCVFMVSVTIQDI